MQIYLIFYILMLEPTEIQETNRNEIIIKKEFEVKKIINKKTNFKIIFYKIKQLKYLFKDNI